jgi:mevalonate kinase
MVDTSPGESTLWTVKSKRQIWHLSEVSLGNPEFVMGYSGRPSNASEMRAKLRRFHDRNSFARDLVRDLGKIPREGRLALEKNNPERIGELMNMSQKILQNLGLGTPELDKMIKAASRHSYGAKLTGGGGCMVALARDPGKAAEAIRGAGGTAILLQLAREGVRPED